MSNPLNEALERYAREFNASANLQYFGMEIAFPESDGARLVEAYLKVKPEHRGGLGSAVFSRAALFDGEGRACAHGMGVIRMSNSTWANGSSPAIG